MKTRIFYIFLISLFSYQYATAQNLLSNPSGEAGYGTNGGSINVHNVAPWTEVNGFVACSNQVSFGDPMAAPSEGSYFFNDRTFSGAIDEISQIVDLGGDQSGKTFFYSYDYRMSDMTARPTHTADVLITFLNASDFEIGNVHLNFDFTDTQLDGDYITVSGTNVAPAGTRKIKWFVRWDNPDNTLHRIIMDNFILKMQPEHDICENAIPLECGDFVLGQTQAATDAMTSNDTPAVLAAYNTCPFLVPAADRHGVFYSFVGTGREVIVSTDYFYTRYDSRISIYTGTCSAPVCVAENDDIDTDGCTGPDSNLKSQVTFPTVNGQTYYIYVHGTPDCSMSKRGTFGLSLDCAAGIPIPFPCGKTISGDTRTDDNTYSGIDYSACSSFVGGDGKDEVYEFEVLEREDYTITLSGLTDNLDLLLVQVDEQANIINCVGTSSLPSTNNESITATLSPGSYRIIVDGFGSSDESSFTMNISCEFDANFPNFLLLYPKVFLQGALKSSAFPAMNTTLQANGLIPSVAPDGSGTVAENGIGTDIVDWVIVELRDANNNSIVRARQSCLLRQDGQVLGANQAPFLFFPALDFDEAYVVVRHRNHLGIMSGSLVSF